MTVPLALDSPRWNELDTRMGDGGPVRDTLAYLSSAPEDTETFGELWPDICSEGTTYDAGYAAAPYLVTFAKAVPGRAGLEYLIVLGLIATDADEVPADLEAAYRDAVAQGLAVTLERLTDCPVDESLRYLLATVAALRGRTELADLLQNLDAVREACPSCGTDVYPGELQGVLDRERRLASG